MLSLMFLHGIYLSIFCDWEFILVPVTYLALAYGIYKRSNVARYLTLILLLLHLLINISTLRFVYYPISAAEFSGADQFFEVEFDEARFLAEIIPPTIIAAVVFIFLLLPKVVKGYRNNA
jgi:hypothetical protein